jgi:hypothetical protein
MASPPEHPVGIAAKVVAYGNHRGVHETDARALAEGREVEEKHHLEEHPALQLDKAVVGHSIGEIRPEMLSDIEQVVVLEVAERTELERYQDGHNLTL